MVKVVVGNGVVRIQFEVVVGNGVVRTQFEIVWLENNLTDVTSLVAILSFFNTSYSLEVLKF